MRRDRVLAVEREAARGMSGEMPVFHTEYKVLFRRNFPDGLRRGRRAEWLDASYAREEEITRSYSQLQKKHSICRPYHASRIPFRLFILLRLAFRRLGSFSPMRNQEKKHMHIFLISFRFVSSRLSERRNVIRIRVYREFAWNWNWEGMKFSAGGSRAQIQTRSLLADVRNRHVFRLCIPKSFDLDRDPRTYGESTITAAVRVKRNTNRKWRERTAKELQFAPKANQAAREWLRKRCVTSYCRLLILEFAIRMRDDWHSFFLFFFTLKHLNFLVKRAAVSRGARKSLGHKCTMKDVSSRSAPFSCNLIPTVTSFDCLYRLTPLLIV